MDTIPALIDGMALGVSDLLESLSSEQRARACLRFEEDEERRRWYYTPTPRAGLRLGDLDPMQQQKVMRLMATGLSEAGYNHAALVMGLENIVARHSGFPERTYGNLPHTRLRDPANYFVAVFGSPGDETGWSWRLEGHHLSLHYTIRDGSVFATPAFFGAEPARAVMPGGVLLRPLAAEEDNARELLAMLRPEQLKQAVIAPVAPTDIVQMNRPFIEDGALPPIGGPGPGGERLRAALGLTPELDEMVRFSMEPKGLTAADMDEQQRDVLVRLVGSYLDHLPEAAMAGYLPLLEASNLQRMAFAWAGSLEFGDPHYYRVQSQELLIEYDCTQNEANHTHSVLRSLTEDFGGDPLADHYAAAHSNP
jgi:hypothetical protein